MAAATLRSALRRNRLLTLFETRRLRDLLFFSSSVDHSGGTISPDPHFMVEYLVNSCGFSPSEAANILHLNVHRSFVPRLETWESLLGSRELVLEHLKKKSRFFGSSIEKTVHPNLKFLTDECSIPEERVFGIVKWHPQFISQNPESLRALVARAEELGMPRQSRMFMRALNVLQMLSKERFEAKVELMRSFGWSDSEFSSAVRKAPTFLSFSTDMLRRKVTFFIDVVGFTPSFIAYRSNLLLFSLQKRVIPRFRVMEMLKLKGLWTGQVKFLSILSLSETKFMERFVLPHRQNVPQLLDILRVAGGRV
ncbi:hypothetical protein BHE74_00027527 [Ensete ventricosum]|nr:hypothetical protein BHE74_00027527 [Ensete ventricosum]